MVFLYHPLVVHFPVALWMTSALFELLYVARRENLYATVARLLIGLGLLGAAVSIASGWIDLLTQVKLGVGTGIATQHRIRAILRRTGSGAPLPETGPLQSDGLALHPETHEVWLRGRPVDLTAKEFELLKLLMRHPNRVFTRDFLLEHIWGYDYFGSTRTVDMHISRLREKIEDAPAASTFIQTVRGVGYKFKAGTRGRGRR